MSIVGGGKTDNCSSYRYYWYDTEEVSKLTGGLHPARGKRTPREAFGFAPFSLCFAWLFLFIVTFLFFEPQRTLNDKLSLDEP